MQIQEQPIRFCQFFDHLEKRRLLIGTALLATSYFCPLANPGIRLISAGMGLSSITISLNPLHEVLSEPAKKTMAMVQSTLMLVAYGSAGIGYIRLFGLGESKTRVSVLQ